MLHLSHQFATARGSNLTHVPVGNGLRCGLAAALPQPPSNRRGKIRTRLDLAAQRMHHELQPIANAQHGTPMSNT